MARPKNLENDLPKDQDHAKPEKARGALVEMSHQLLQLPSSAGDEPNLVQVAPNSSRGAEPIRSGADDDDAKQAERLKASVEGV